jgi:hypothetical protein
MAGLVLQVLGSGKRFDGASTILNQLLKNSRLSAIGVDAGSGCFADYVHHPLNRIITPS